MSGPVFCKLDVGEVLDLIRVPQPTCILFHVNPDADAIGSAFALAELLQALGSETYCLSADEVPERMRFLTDGLQESCLLKSLPARFEGARVISVDSAAPNQLGALFETFGDRISLMIDHHGTGTPYADGLIVPDAAATGEIVFDLFAAAGIALSPRAAALLYAAISSDTGGFRYSNTTKGTHVRAAALVEKGIDVAELSYRLFEAKSLAQLRAEHAGFEAMHLYDGGKIAIITVPYDTMQALELRPEHVGTLVDIARSVAGVEVAVAIRQTAAEPVFRVSMRANVDFDVAAVAASFGGGGHRRAAGATVHAADAAEAERLVLEAVRAAMA